ncbi:unnamed protein product [Closterium sp. NIES-64]|nr:unnamed protein product [Closterium sp. NIES-64]
MKKRVLDAAPPSTRHRMTKRTRHALTAKEKLHWLAMLDSQSDLSIRGLARLAKVQPKQIREWKRLKERLEVSAGCRRRLHGGGRKAKWPAMERAVNRQFLAHRAKGLAVPLSLLRKWSLKYMKHRQPAADFRASAWWTFRFRIRWSLAKRVKTKMGQKLTAKDGPLPNPFYEDLANAPEPAATEGEEEEEAEPGLDGEADGVAAAAEGLEATSLEEEDEADEVMGEADEWSDDGEEWWAPGRFDGEEVEEWVAGQE